MSRDHRRPPTARPIKLKREREWTNRILGNNDDNSRQESQTARTSSDAESSMQRLKDFIQMEKRSSREAVRPWSDHTRFTENIVSFTYIRRRRCCLTIHTRSKKLRPHNRDQWSNTASMHINKNLLDVSHYPETRLVLWYSPSDQSRPWSIVTSNVNNITTITSPVPVPPHFFLVKGNGGIAFNIQSGAICTRCRTVTNNKCNDGRNQSKLMTIPLNYQFLDESAGTHTDSWLIVHRSTTSLRPLTQNDCHTWDIRLHVFLRGGLIDDYNTLNIGNFERSGKYPGQQATCLRLSPV